MNTQKDNHSITGSPLMILEFIIIHTIIWGFALCILFYVLDLFLAGFFYLPGQMNRFPFILLFYYLRMLVTWPGVMFTALIITVIRCLFRRTEVTLSGDTVIIRRLRHTERLVLADFIRPKTVESYINIHFIGWVFRRRYLIFRDAAGKEVKYRLFEYSEKDLNQVMQLLTRVNYTEHLAEDEKTEIMMESFQYATEITLDPRHIWAVMARRLLILCVISLAVFGVSIVLFYRMLTIPPQYDTASALLTVIGYGSILFSLCSLFVLCRALWTLVTNAALRLSCPQKIAFIGNMLQVDHTTYSVNRIRRIVMNPPARKLPLFGHYQITIITTEGTHKYWLGNAKGLSHGTWQTLCRNMQSLLISCPAKLTYQ